MPGWLALVALCIAALAFYRSTSLGGELDRESAYLQAEISQRADQHDAHLTALSAVARAEGDRQAGPLMEVISTIRQFYPRIGEIQIVPLDEASAVAGSAPLEPDLAQAIREAARASDGHAVLFTTPFRPDTYVMVKRSPNNANARDAIGLIINVQLLESAAPFWSEPGVARRLSLASGEPVFGPAELAAGTQVTRELSSASQPLVLTTARPSGWAEWLPTGPLIALLVGASALYFAAIALWRQRVRTREAERRAELADLDARLTHASRVNAMGEMASGMAHELTQPLTAILAQAQAGRRLLATDKLEPLGGALEDVVAQARRASAILDRLRNWSRPQGPSAAPVDLRSALANVRALLAADATRLGVTLDIRSPEAAVTVTADPVEMEQVMFNLTRNAMEAVEREQEKRVTVTLTREAGQAVLEVADSGPGVPEELRPRLFTPFTTTRPDGTGLGLALSQRLVERAGGDIALVDQPGGAVFRVTLPLADGGSA